MLTFTGCGDYEGLTSMEQGQTEIEPLLARYHPEILKERLSGRAVAKQSRAQAAFK